MARKTVLSESLEDYLEAISHIVAERRVARVKDIAERQGVNNSSVTGALHALSERGLVNYTPYDVITLTAKGEAAARDIIRRHDTLLEFFEDVLGVDHDEAEAVACRVEHAIPRELFGRLDRFVQSYRQEH